MRQSGRRRQPQRRANGALARGTSNIGPGRDCKSPLRLRNGRSCERVARRTTWRRRCLHRRWCREHDARAIYVASEAAVKKYGLTPRARVVASAVAGVEPRIMGMGPVPASRMALEKAGLSLSDMSVIELNEAFAAQSLACLRELGLDDDDARVNPNGGAIALGHPLGMSGARLLLTASRELEEKNEKYALCTMCIGVGQGMATIIERV